MDIRVNYMGKFFTSIKNFLKLFSKSLFCILFGFLLCLFLIISAILIIQFESGSFPTLTWIKNFGESLKPIFEIAAIIIAGIWSYHLFVKKRVDYPFPETNHTITHRNLENGKLFLCLIVTIKNAGNVLLELKTGRIFIRQIRPIHDDLINLMHNANITDLREGKVSDLFQEKCSKIKWHEIGYRELQWGDGEIRIEPGEVEEFQYDFILDDSIRTISVITYFRNDKLGEPEVGWRKTTLFDLQGDNKEITMDDKKENPKHPYEVPFIKSQPPPERPAEPSQPPPERTPPPPPRPPSPSSPSKP